MSILEDKIKSACNMCENHGYRSPFDKIYPFTTENIDGYMTKLNVYDKSILTVGSSGDQVINALLFGSSKQTVIDVCPFTKYYFYLKKAALLSLTKEEYLNFFVTRDNGYISGLDKDTFYKISKCLKDINNEAYLFWNTLFYLFDNDIIRERMFTYDVYDKETIIKLNSYLKKDFLYNSVSKKIDKCNPTFIDGDILKTNFDDKVDRIILSNLYSYCAKKDYLDLLSNLKNKLGKDGIMMFAYVYDAMKKMNDKFAYDPDVLLGDIVSYCCFINDTYTFDSANDFYKDMALVYKK